MAPVERDQLPTRDNPRDRADYRECDRSHRDGATIVCLRASAIRLVRPSATPTFERGKERLRDITKQGDPYIRKLLIIGATAVLRFSRHRAPAADWTSGLLARRPPLAVAVALANNMARIVWAILTRGEAYRAAPAPA